MADETVLAARCLQVNHERSNVALVVVVWAVVWMGVGAAIVAALAYGRLVYARDTYATDPRYVPCHSPSGYCLKNEQRSKSVWREKMKNEQEAYDKGYDNPAVPIRCFPFHHLVDINAFHCGQMDAQNQQPRNREYRRDDYDPCGERR